MLDLGDNRREWDEALEFSVQANRCDNFPQLDCGHAVWHVGANVGQLV